MGKALPILVAPQPEAPAKGQSAFAFLLIDGFSHLALAGALETLAAANAALAQPAYVWSVVTLDGQPVRGSAGLTIAPDAAYDVMPRQAVLVVMGGRHLSGLPRRRILSLLRREAAHGRQLVGVADAVSLLAEAGVLANLPCAVHWREAAAFVERFPDLDIRVSAFVRSRHSTISGCVATTDFFLDRIRSDRGPKAAQIVADQITHRAARDGDAPQTASQTCRIGDRSATILRIVQAMEANISTPLAVADLATDAGVSVRQLERQFLRVFGTTPLRFYVKLRLERARDLLAQTDIPLVDIADLTGFAGVAMLSRQYRKAFGLSPSDKVRTEHTPPKHQDADQAKTGRTGTEPKKGLSHDRLSRPLSQPHLA